jgi:hypothetical protein
VPTHSEVARERCQIVRGAKIEDQESGRGILTYNWACFFWGSANSPGGVLGWFVCAYLVMSSGRS